LSIGDLAAEVGMSKSGLYAHFKSKEDLELATIELAASILDREVVRPAHAAPAGSQKLRAVVDSFLTYLKRQVFPGGCFFAAVGMELDTRPGLARDKVVEVQQNWLSLLRQCFLDAKAIGEIDSGADVEQAVFETQAMLVAANSLFVMSNDSTRLAQARKGVEHVLARLAIRAEPKQRRSTHGKS
jgi:AcrR family transcriptional regulator